MNQKLKETFENLNKWSERRMRNLSNGAIQICHVPHVAPLAWLHEYYVGLKEDEISKLENKIKISFPYEYREFLSITNGLNIFSDSLSVFGLRFSYVREGDEAAQPYSLDLERRESLLYSPKNWLIVGGYEWDGSRVFIDLNTETKKVYRCEYQTDNILNEWPNFYTWLLEETKRLSLLFDEIGVQYDKDFPTTP